MHKKSILLIEDDAILQKTITKALQKEFNITTHETAKKGLRAIQNYSFDLFILDIILPDKDGKNGLDLCKIIRRQNNQVPILMLTGKTAINFKLGAFKFGADDYLCKPFNLLELRARIRALLKRVSTNNENTEEIIRHGNICINQENRTVYKDDIIVNLRRSEFDILLLLMKNKSKIFSRENIMRNALDKDEIESNSIDVHISNLRKKIESAEQTNIIKTVYGIGYTLNND